MSKYGQYLGSAISMRVNAMQEKALNILSLRDELILLQVVVGDVIQGWANASEIIKSTPGMKAEDADRIMSIARGRLYDGLDRIRDMTLAAKRVEESGSTQVDVSILNAVVTQIVEIVDEELNTVEDSMSLNGMSAIGVMDRIAQRAHKELLSVRDIPKTTLTPERLEAEVSAMHDTIPAVRQA